MSKFGRLFGTTMMLGLLSTTLAFAEYAEAPVADGGSITGKVTLKGNPPPPQSFSFEKFPQPKYCSQADSDGKGNRVRQDVKVKGGGLSDAVVFIEKIEKGKPFKFEGTQVKAHFCEFLVQGGPSQSVGVVMKGKDISFTNEDADPSEEKSKEGVLHNPHGYEMKGSQSTTLFNKPLPKKGQTIKETIKPIAFKKEDSFMKVECDQHNYMNVWFLPVASPYYAIVNEDGTFSIDDVPPGEYELKAFHPSLGFVEQKGIKVAAKGKATANFEFTGK
ncbi:MAG: carboxypeptidase regulatory-like domain-containing protein [Nitrospirae bacterium]|nr:carboxypeptidase regulatory-like domain-containing protein [Candidatus Manganitrophaceae bacterium]